MVLYLSGKDKREASNKERPLEFRLHNTYITFL